MEVLTTAQELQQQINRLNESIEDERQKIKPYANYHAYTDVHPYQVLAVRTPRLVIVRVMRTKQTKFPKEFHAGGFCGHYSNNYSGQAYEYFDDPDAVATKIRWSKAKRRWQDKYGRRFVMADQPYKFYDYNF